MQVASKPSVLVSILAVATLCCGASAFAGEEMLGLDAKFRAKIAKEKVRVAAQERKAAELDKKGLQDSDCGSQSIGNVDTRGGPAPRELFVFAPNAINIVGRSSCR